MSMKGKRRQKLILARQRRRAEKDARMRKMGEQSNYARKKRYLDKNGLWGFEVPEPKPWKTKR